MLFVVIYNMPTLNKIYLLYLLTMYRTYMLIALKCQSRLNYLLNALSCKSRLNYMLIALSWKSRLNYMLIALSCKSRLNYMLIALSCKSRLNYMLIALSCKSRLNYMLIALIVNQGWTTCWNIFSNIYIFRRCNVHYIIGKYIVTGVVGIWSILTLSTLNATKVALASQVRHCCSRLLSFLVPLVFVRMRLYCDIRNLSRVYFKQY